MKDTNIAYVGEAYPHVKIIHQDDTAATIAGYGVVFGGRDLTGEFFTPETHYGRNYGKGSDVYIDHSLPSIVEHDGKTYLVKGIDSDIGEIITVDPDDIGLYMQLQIQKQTEYWPIVEQMIATGKAGLSTRNRWPFGEKRRQRNNSLANQRGVYNAHTSGAKNRRYRIY